MQVSGWLLGTLVLVAVAVVAATRWMSKRNILSGRNSISLADILARHDCNRRES